MKIPMIIASLLIFTNCSKPKTAQVQPNAVSVKDSGKPLENDTISISKKEVIKKMNKQILASLKTKNYAQFLKYIHPKEGVSFSMYSYLQSDNKKFSTSEFEKYITTNIKFTWGEKDGTGDLLILSLKEYMEKWVFARDYTKSTYFLNEFKGSGNALNNIKEQYPDADFTENYISGTEKYGEMDWKSLIFVFKKLNGNYYLVAVVNNSWTT